MARHSVSAVVKDTTRGKISADVVQWLKDVRFLKSLERLRWISKPKGIKLSVRICKIDDKFMGT